MALRCALGLRVLLSSGVSSRMVTVGSVQARPLSLTATNFLKEIIVQEEGNQLIIKGAYIESPRTPLLIKTGHDENHTCCLCALNLDLKHTDVLILSQFMRADGGMLHRRITGLCGKQQKRVRLLVAMAQRAGLMPNLTPWYSKKDPKKRFGSKKYNRYFDETTLDVKPKRK
ncbi:large ribosomal subunit protein mL66 [Procambarus clarkii]|uniref:large ribosomal subunit protein mL66 n=1 Tax=Procambarus clarkii TaxID=6728 RepID=UPI0037442921